MAGARAEVGKGTDVIPDQPGEEEVDLGFKDLAASGAPNVYVLKRNFIHQLMDVALLMANVSQLKALLSLETSDRYFYLLLVFICLSISLQVIFTLCMLALWSIEKTLEAGNQDDKAAHQVALSAAEQEVKQKMADRLDKVGNVLVLTIIVANVFITGFGVESHGNPVGPAPPQTPVTQIANGTSY